MMIRRALLAMSLGLAGCFATVNIPNTPEALACERECMFLRNSCMMSDQANPYQGFACNGQQHSCLLTCPGAYE